MIDIVDRLKFDATRCELQFSKGVAANISEGIAEITRLRMKQERMWCRACGAVTRNEQCDCTREETGTQMLVNYADSMQEDARELSQKVEQMRVALETIAGARPCSDNLLGNADIARLALEQKAGNT